MTIRDTLTELARTTDAHIMVNFHAKDAQAARALIRTLGGPFKKNSFDGQYWLEDSVGRLSLSIFVPSMCERHQTGTQQMPEIPAQPAQPAHEAPVYTYTCKALWPE